MDFRTQYSQLLNRSGSGIVNHRKDINILSFARRYENSPKKYSEKTLRGGMRVVRKQH